VRHVFVLALFTLQAIFISILLIERKRRNRNRTTGARNIDKKPTGDNLSEQSRIFIERMVDTMPSVLFIYDLVERRNVYVNQRSSVVIGYSAEEIIDMGDAFLTRLMHPDDLASLPQLNQLYQARPAGAVFDNVFRLKHKNGEWRWVHRCATIFL